MKIFSADITGSTSANIQAFDSNPTTPAISDGSIWINRGGSINFAFNSGSTNAGVWTAGAAFSPGRVGGAGFGSQNAFAYAGGSTHFGQNSPAYPFIDDEVYEYDGEAWAAGGALNASRAVMGSAGSQNAGVVFGGSCCNTRPAPAATTKLTCTEEYDGASWATQEAMNTGRGYLGGQGTQNASLAFGGGACSGYSSTNDCSCVEEYDGTDWSVGNVFNAFVNTPTDSDCGAGGIASSGGSQNSTLIMGGSELYYTGYYMRAFPIGEELRCAFVELYDGTSWSAQTAFSEKRTAASAFGTANDTVMTGGATDYATANCVVTCLWDGSAWSTGNSLNHARAMLASNTDGASNDGIVTGGTQWESSNTYDYANFRCCTEHWDRNTATSLISKQLVAKDGIISASSNVNGSISQSIASTGSFGSGQFTSVHANSHLRVNTTVVNNNSVSASLASTASFGRVRAQGTISGGKFVGDGTGLTGVTATLFDGDNKLSGSLTSTGSFGNVKGAGTVEANTFKGDGSQLTNVATSNTIEITGSFRVQSTEPITVPLLTADPAISTLRPGSVWINRVTGALNFSYLSSSITDRAWSAGGTIGDGKVFRTSVGTQNAQILFNGYCPPPAPASNNSCISEEVKCYDGTSWTVSPASTTSEHVARGGAGLQNSALAFGGISYEGPSNAYDGQTGDTEAYDGTSWTECNNVLVDRTAWSSVGTQNSVITFAGTDARTGYVFDQWTEYNVQNYTLPCNETLGWDGTNWVACNDLVTNRVWQASFGTVGAAVAAGGMKSPGGNAGNTEVEEWDGTSWATGEALTTGRSKMGGAGTQNDGLVFGGIANPGYSNSYCDDTETYDGTNWSTGPNLGTARLTFNNTGGGTSIAAFYVGSWEWDCYASAACCTEEYTEGSLDTTLVRRMSGSAYTY